MAAYRLRIGASGPPDPYPEWRMAMQSGGVDVVDTLYYASLEAPSDADSKVVWPSGTAPSSQSNEMGWWTISGYSGGYFVPDIGGTHGSLVIGTGGHDAMGTELLRYNLSEDAPTFDWWQQPIYEQTDTGDVDIFYDPGLSSYDLSDGNWNAWITAGKPYPVSYNGWVYPRPIQAEEVSLDTPKGFRFYCMAYVPPSITGTGDGVLIKVRSNQGPWSQGGRPLNSGGSNIPVEDWYNTSWYWSGYQDFKSPIHVKNTRTGAWSKLPLTDPFFARSASAYIPSHAHLCAPKKRVYVWCDSTGGTGFYYIDLTAGIAGATVSSYVTPALGSAHALDPYAGVNVIEIDGRNLAFGPTLNAPDSILWWDLDTTPNQFVVGPLTGFSRTNYLDERWIWDAANRRILIVGHSNAGAYPITYQTITVPADVTDASGYVVSTKVNLATAVGVSVQTSSWMYGKVFLHPTLNCVFVPQDRHKMLAFVPGV